MGMMHLLKPLTDYPPDGSTAVHWLGVHYLIAEPTWRDLGRLAWQLLPWRRPRTFAVALARHTANGFKAVAQDVYDRRVALCMVCENFEGNTCKLCGCAVQGPMLEKARWESEKCPMGKW